MSNEKQACKVFCGGLSWETSSERLRAYFENFGVVREAFVSYNRNNGRPRGFGFVVFESSDVADKVVATKHTIDRREVECKKAVPKEENAASSPPSSNEGGGAGSSVGASAIGGMGAGSAGGRTRKVFVGGLAPGVDEKLLRQHFEQFGAVEDAVVMYDHDNKRPRGFGFVTFAQEDSVDKVFGRGVMQSILDKQIEIKAAVPRDQMPPTATAPHHQHGRNMGPAFYESPRGYGRGGYNQQQQMQQPPFGMYGAPGYGAPPPPSREPGYGPKGPGGQQPQGPGNFANYNGGRGAGNKNMQQYINPMGPGFGGNQRGGAGGAGGYPGTGKLPAAYDQLNLQAYMQQQQQPNSGNNHANMGFPNNTNTAALYNLTGFPPQLNNMQPSNGGGKLNAFNNQINLKAALGALGVTNFPPHTSGNEGYPDGTGMYGGQEEFDAATAAAAASGLTVQPDYSFGHDTNFTTSPGPGWSG